MILVVVGGYDAIELRARNVVIINILPPEVRLQIFFQMRASQPFGPCINENFVNYFAVSPVPDDDGGRISAVHIQMMNFQR